jgi:hypothetical protein
MDPDADPGGPKHMDPPTVLRIRIRNTDMQSMTVLIGIPSSHPAASSLRRPPSP